MITFGGFAFLSDLPSAVRVPVAALIFTGPFTILCAIAGQIADKFDRGVIFRWVKRAEVLIMALAAVGFALKNVHILRKMPCFRNGWMRKNSSPGMP